MTDQGSPHPPAAGDDADMLLGFLDRQRATFAWKTGGLDAAGLRAALDPSPLTLGGLLKHLARFEDDMTSEWLLGGEQRPPWNTIDWEADRDWDHRSAAEDSPEHLYAGWEQAVARARSLFNQALAERGLDRPVGDGAPSPRYILLNMIEEYARHNGHADLIRESVDGLVGHDPPE